MSLQPVPCVAGAAPVFFLSYAHTPKVNNDRDPDSYLVKFYWDICRSLVQISDLPLGDGIGFMDRELRPGDEWPLGSPWPWRTARSLFPCDRIGSLRPPGRSSTPTGLPHPRCRRRGMPRRAGAGRRPRLAAERVQLGSRPLLSRYPDGAGQVPARPPRRTDGQSGDYCSWSLSHVRFLVGKNVAPGAVRPSHLQQYCDLGYR
jgi:hypothetical protein